MKKNNYNINKKINICNNKSIFKGNINKVMLNTSNIFIMLNNHKFIKNNLNTKIMFD